MGRKKKEGRNNIAAAKAVDREFNYIFGSDLGRGRRGGCAPPRTPLLFRGAPPPGSPKRCSAPLAAAVVRFLATEPLVRGSFAAWGIFFLRNPTFFEESTWPGQLRCLGQNFLSKMTFFLNKPLVPGSFAAWGRTVSRKSEFFLNKPLVPGSSAAWGRTVSQNLNLFF